MRSRTRGAGSDQCSATQDSVFSAARSVRVAERSEKCDRAMPGRWPIYALCPAWHPDRPYTPILPTSSQETGTRLCSGKNGSKPELLVVQRGNPVCGAGMAEAILCPQQD